MSPFYKTDKGLVLQYEGEGKKKPGYREFSSLYITKELVDLYDSGEKNWNEMTIDSRTEKLCNTILEIWPDQF